MQLLLLLLLQVAFAREDSSEASHNEQAHLAAEQLASKVCSLRCHRRPPAVTSSILQLQHTKHMLSSAESAAQVILP